MTLLSALATGAVLLPTLALAAVQLPVDPPVDQVARAGAPTSPPITPSSTTATVPIDTAAATPESAGRADPDRPPPENVMQTTPMGRWAWPLNPRPRVVHDFVVGPHPWSPGHRGVDLAGATTSDADPGGRGRPPAGSGLPPGTPIRAPATGIVHFAGIVAGRPVLSIAHGSDLVSSFEPAISTFERGHPVQRNEIVGRVAAGPTHCAPGICLHWGVRQNERYINPLLLLPVQRGPAVLLPLPHQ